MSMISSQIDELRQMADGGATYRDLREVMLRAADTIMELRDDLQQANAENAKLREELADAPKCEACEAMLDCDECLRADGSHKERRRLSFENAKLRELCADMMRFFEDEDWCTICEQACKCDSQEQYEEDCLMRAVFHDRMRELGIEVNDG